MKQEVKEESGCTESIDNNGFKHPNKININNEETSKVNKVVKFKLEINMNENILKKNIPANFEVNKGTNNYFNLPGTIFPSPCNSNLGVYNNSSFVKKDSIKSLLTNELCNSIEENIYENNIIEQPKKEKVTEKTVVKYDKCNQSFQKGEKKFLIRLNDLKKIIV